MVNELTINPGTLPGLFVDDRPRLLLGTRFLVKPTIPLALEDSYAEAAAPAPRIFRTDPAVFLEELLSKDHVPLSLLDPNGDVLDLGDGVSVVKPAGRYQLRLGGQMVLSFAVLTPSEDAPFSFVFQPVWLNPSVSGKDQALERFYAYLEEEARINLALAHLTPADRAELPLRYALDSSRIARALARPTPSVTSVTNPRAVEPFIPNVVRDLGDKQVRRVGVFGVGYMGGKTYVADEWARGFPNAEIFAFDCNEKALGAASRGFSSKIIPFLMDFSTQPLPENLKFDFIDCSFVLSFLERSRPGSLPQDETLMKSFFIQLMNALTVGGVIMATSVPRQLLESASLLGFTIEELEPDRYLFHKTREVPFLQELSSSAAATLLSYSPSPPVVPMLPPHEVLRRVGHQPLLASLSPQADVVVGTADGEEIYLHPVPAKVGDHVTKFQVEPGAPFFIFVEVDLPRNQLIVYYPRDLQVDLGREQEIFCLLVRYFVREASLWGLEYREQFTSPIEQEPYFQEHFLGERVVVEARAVLLQLLGALKEGGIFVVSEGLLPKETITLTKEELEQVGVRVENEWHDGPIRVSAMRPNVEERADMIPLASQSPTHFAALLESAGLNVDEYADILEPDAFEMLKNEGQLEGLVASLREGDQAAFNSQMAEVEGALYETPRRLNYSVPSGMQRTVVLLARLVP